MSDTHYVVSHDGTTTLRIKYERHQTNAEITQEIRNAGENPDDYRNYDGTYHTRSFM
jgi:hypothetical protein